VHKFETHNLVNLSEVACSLIGSLADWRQSKLVNTDFLGFNACVSESENQKPEEVEIRRAPKVLPMALTGAAIGALLAVVLFLLIPEANRSSANIFGLLILALGSLGLGLGVAFSIVVDISTSRRAKRALANKVTE
jgi:disulfide bond formation protein DsbB